jgi:hypothetical protein
MVQILDVAAVMPSEDIGLLTVDQVGHGVNPLRGLYSCQPSILCILHNLEDVTTFECITVIAYAALHCLKLASGLAFFGRKTYRPARHL